MAQQEGSTKARGPSQDAVVAAAAAAASGGEPAAAEDASSSCSLNKPPTTPRPLPPIVRGHDYFNLVALAGLNILNMAFLCGRPWAGPALLWTSLAYFLVDMVGAVRMALCSLQLHIL